LGLEYVAVGGLSRHHRFSAHGRYASETHRRKQAERTTNSLIFVAPWGYGGATNKPARYYRVRLVPKKEIDTHQTNEAVPVDALIKATIFYAAIPQIIVVETKKR
jgi:hypothetical protein